MQINVLNVIRSALSTILGVIIGFLSGIITILAGWQQYLNRDIDIAVVIRAKRDRSGSCSVKSSTCIRDGPPPSLPPLSLDSSADKADVLQNSILCVAKPRLNTHPVESSIQTSPALTAKVPRPTDSIEQEVFDTMTNELGKNLPALYKQGIKMAKKQRFINSVCQLNPAEQLRIFFKYYPDCFTYLSATSQANSAFLAYSRMSGIPIQSLTTEQKQDIIGCVICVCSVVGGVWEGFPDCTDLACHKYHLGVAWKPSNPSVIRDAICGGK